MSSYKFVPIKEVPTIYKKTKNQELLEAFLDSGIETCELKLDKEPKNSATTLRKSANRFSLPVDVFVRQGKIYLVRRKI